MLLLPYRVSLERKYEIMGYFIRDTLFSYLMAQLNENRKTIIVKWWYIHPLKKYDIMKITGTFLLWHLTHTKTTTTCVHMYVYINVYICVFAWKCVCVFYICMEMVRIIFTKHTVSSSTLSAIKMIGNYLLYFL